MAGRAEALAGCSRTVLDDNQLIPTDRSKPVFVGTRAIGRFRGTDELVDLPRRHFLLAEALAAQIPLEEAAEKLKLSPEEASRIMNLPICQEYIRYKERLANRADIAQDKQRWWARVDMGAEGEIPLTKAQVEMIREAGRRIVSPQGEGCSVTKIEINIDPGAVREAFRRQQSIDAEIVKEHHAA